jgi:molybdopterin converting factor small subunit
MNIKVRIPPTLRQFTGGREVVKSTGNTVKECLDNLEVQFPGIKQELYDKRGEISPYYEIYINEESAYPDELVKPVKDGDEITIITLIAGG